MNARHAYAIWAPPESPWSPWAKPSLFADLGRVFSTAHDEGPINVEDVSWLPIFDKRTAIVIDLPGGVAVTRGLQLTRRGYRPVPLFNTSHEGNAAVSVREILEGLNTGRRVIPAMEIPADAPPAFLLDSKRLGDGRSPPPGIYDNRWTVLPQDFPSAAKLREHGIAAVLLWQRENAQPADDLAHVLRRWQDAGLDIYLEYGDLPSPPVPLTVHRPSRYKSILHRLFVLAGLRRNSAGGFGSIVPEPSQSGGYG
jgi:hypothetical protein